GFAPGFRDDVTLLAGETLVGVDLVLATGGVMLSGQVSDTGGGAIATAAITVQLARRHAVTTLGDSSGRYALRVPPGECAASAAADGYAPEHAQLVVGADQTHD